MVNEYSYCPRLAYLEWVQGEWADSADTVEGRHAHRRVDRVGGSLPAAGDEDFERLHARSVTLSSERLGLIARIDLIEAEDGLVVPVDYKRGKRPHVKGGAYEPERVQLCVQGLILRDHGYRCEEGVLYFVAGRERVGVVFDEELVAATEQAVAGLRRVASEGVMPPPLEDSPKCPRCSLVSICLPDEINHLSLLSRPGMAPRPIAVPGTDALPLYVQARGAKVAKSGENLVVSVKDETVTKARLPETSQVVLMGSVYVTTPCLQELMWRGIPVTWHSHGGWFYGHTVGNGHKNVELRTAQYRASFDEEVCLRFAKDLVRAKILNCRTLLRRNWKGPDSSHETMIELRDDSRHAARVRSLSVLLGVEGRGCGTLLSGVPRHDQRGAANRTRGIRLRETQPPAANRPGQRAALVYLLIAGACLDRDAGGGRIRSVSRSVAPATLRAPGPGPRSHGAVPSAARRFRGAAGHQQWGSAVERLQDRGWRRCPHAGRQAEPDRRLRAPLEPRDRSSAVRLPRELPPPHGDAGSSPGPLPARRNPRVSQLHDALSRWKSTSTSSPTTYPIPGAGGRCSR